MSVSRNHLATVRSEIVSQGLNTPDDEIYSGPLHEEMDDQCISMMFTGGPQADSFFEDDETIQRPNVQIRLRGTNYDEIESDARDIWGLMQNNQPADYLKIYCLQSGPLYTGTDEDGRHVITINIELWIVE